MITLRILLFGLLFVVGVSQTTTEEQDISERSEADEMTAKMGPQPVSLEGRSGGIVTPDGNPITTRVVDRKSGRPATNMKVLLYRWTYYSSTRAYYWNKLSEKRTNENGLAMDMIPKPSSSYFVAAMYKLEFDALSYFKAQGENKTFFPKVEVEFQVENLTEHYHVPLFLSTNGYTAHRGLKPVCTALPN